jgi:hypothetical protein
LTLKVDIIYNALRKVLSIYEISDILNVHSVYRDCLTASDWLYPINIYNTHLSFLDIYEG